MTLDSFQVVMLSLEGHHSLFAKYDDQIAILVTKHAFTTCFFRKCVS
jgi:hypothetical protein